MSGSRTKAWRPATAAAPGTPDTRTDASPAESRSSDSLSKAAGSRAKAVSKAILFSRSVPSRLVATPKSDRNRPIPPNPSRGEEMMDCNSRFIASTRRSPASAPASASPTPRADNCPSSAFAAFNCSTSAPMLVRAVSMSRAKPTVAVAPAGAVTSMLARGSRSSITLPGRKAAIPSTAITASCAACICTLSFVAVVSRTDSPGTVSSALNRSADAAPVSLTTPSDSVPSPLSTSRALTPGTSFRTSATIASVAPSGMVTR